MVNTILSKLAPGRRHGRYQWPSDVKTRSSSLRPDIQGLRAFAVIAVVLDHLLGWPSGGFVGVDIFFVISGFLITGLLLREHERTGRISFVGFYKRRIKRILPAAVIVLMVTVAASFFVFNKTRAWNTLWDGVWALLFGANWRQASLGTDYFAAGGPVSPLQHYWSLAVEEQFYFVWPWVMLGLFALTSRMFSGRANPRLVAGVAMAIITAGSLAWSMVETASNANLAYFSTFSRTWELGLGALLACAAPLLPRIPSAVRPVLAWLGLAGMVTALFVTDPKVGFPGPGAVLPVVATALVIAAGTGTSEHRFLFPLTNRVSGYLGDISYSLYLWHFPVIIFAASVAPDATGILDYLVVAAIMLVTSVYAYHLVEDPIRKSQWLSGRSNKSGPRHIEVSERYKVTAVAALVTVTVTVVGAALTPHPAPATGYTAPAAAKPSAGATQAASYGPEVAALQTSINAAVQTATWPDNLTPSMDDAIGNHEAPKGVAECGNNVAPAQSECVWGDPSAPKTAMLVGDSVGVAWAPSLIKLYGQGEWKLLMRAQFGCPFVDREPSLDSANCAQHKEATISEVKATKPDLLILSNNYPDSGQSGNWAAGEISILKKGAGAEKTMMLASPPHDKDVQKCYKPGSSPADCVSLANGWYLDLTSSERRAVAEIGGSYVSTLPIFCNANNVCPAFVGNTPVKLDQVHMTLWYAEKSAPALGELISAALK